uniref:Uncharacterized protein n=1 Tax=Meloidogyne enterolobii TaxID=390850 RepID=A0A6V7V0H8_MELEN|nr:unnamed protein product [Meloidogyne enterolobii]
MNNKNDLNNKKERKRKGKEGENNEEEEGEMKKIDKKKRKNNKEDEGKTEEEEKSCLNLSNPSTFKKETERQEFIFEQNNNYWEGFYNGEDEDGFCW